MALRILEIDPSEEREAIEAELCRRSFARFCKRAWREIDPAPLQWGWHLDALCAHLQAVTDGRITKLLINIPPGHAKSMVVSVLWPAWVWGPAQIPWWRVLTSAYDMTLSARDSVRARDLISSEWYRKHFRVDPRVPGGKHTWDLKGDQNVKSYYENDALGFRQCVAVGSGTGKRGDALVIDDAISAEDANSKEAREKVIRWKTETMSSRFNDMARAQQVVIGQRLHEDDLPGYLLKAGGWVHLRLPSEFETFEKGERGCDCETCAAGETPIGWKDPRTQEGELLFPAKFPRKVLEEAKSPQGMGAIAYAGQHQQRPMPASGGVIQREWFGLRWHFPEASEPTHPKPVLGLRRRSYDPRAGKATRVMVTDAAFKKTADSDLVANGVFDVVYPDLYLIDFEWRRMTFNETWESILRLRQKWNTAHGARVGRVWIEDKANGPAVIEVLKGKIPGVIGFEPVGSKEARIVAASAYYQGGNVWLPEHHVDIEKAVAESAFFPKASHDDFLDMLSSAVLLTLSSADLKHLENLITW